MLGVMNVGYVVENRIHDYLSERYEVDSTTGRFWLKRDGRVRLIDFGRESPINRILLPCTLRECNPTTQRTDLAPGVYLTTYITG